MPGKVNLYQQVAEACLVVVIVIVLGAEFVKLFSAVCFQMCLQIICPKINDLIMHNHTFVWLFSTVHLQRSGCVGIEGEDGGAGQWGLQSPGRGSHPLGW